MYSIPKNYENNNIYEDDENVLWNEEEDTAKDTDTDESGAGLYEKIRRLIAKEQQFIDELEADAAEHPDRFHELSRSGDNVPLDYGATEDAFCFPNTLNDVLEKQQRKGDFIDAVFYCPYDILELVAEEYMSSILRELTEDHKYLLFLCALQQYSSTKIAVIRGQTDRNIRKMRGTMLKKIRKKLFATLTEKMREKQPLTLLEKDFLTDSGLDIERQDIEKDKKQ